MTKVTKILAPRFEQQNWGIAPEDFNSDSTAAKNLKLMFLLPITARFLLILVWKYTWDEGRLPFSNRFWCPRSKKVAGSIYYIHVELTKSLVSWNFPNEPFPVWLEVLAQTLDMLVNFGTFGTCRHVKEPTEFEGLLLLSFGTIFKFCVFSPAELCVRVVFLNP